MKSELLQKKTLLSTLPRTILNRLNMLTPAKTSPTVCIAVLNWRGKRYLPDLLNSLIDAVDEFGSNCEIIVLDNNEDDDSDRIWVNENFPSARVIKAPNNDFLYSYNWLLAQLTEKIVILLNNDLKVDRHFILPLVKHFINPNIFAVSSRSYNWEGDYITSGPYLFRQHRGWFYCTPDLSKQYTSYTLFACGGHMAVDREKFLDIGGFDRLFYPAYGEDLDLCVRAWQRQWISIYEPESIVYHFQSGSWNEEGNEKAQYFTLRSNFLFQWRHLTSFPFSVFHTFYLQWLFIRQLLRRNRVWLRAYYDARKIFIKTSAQNSNLPAITSADINFFKKTCGSSFTD